MIEQTTSETSNLTFNSPNYLNEREVDKSNFRNYGKSAKSNYPESQSKNQSGHFNALDTLNELSSRSIKLVLKNIPKSNKKNDEIEDCYQSELYLSDIPIVTNDMDFTLNDQLSCQNKRKIAETDLNNNNININNNNFNNFKRLSKSSSSSSSSNHLHVSNAKHAETRLLHLAEKKKEEEEKFTKEGIDCSKKSIFNSAITSKKAHFETKTKYDECDYFTLTCLKILKAKNLNNNNQDFNKSIMIEKCSENVESFIKFSKVIWTY